jgi:Cdc6-like AAA superfamily ATPase
MSTDFESTLNEAYAFDAPVVVFGAAMRGEEAIRALQVRVPLAMPNRHGLVAGATGTGKTKTLQVLAEQLSDAGVPVFISDIKGDISGLAAPAEVNEKLTARAQAIGFAKRR